VSKPTFDYPKPDARFVWVPCSATDEARDEFLCETLGSNWMPKYLAPRPEFVQHWRKKVAVPEGWEVVPEGAALGPSDLGLHVGDVGWTKLGHSEYYGRKPREAIDRFPLRIAFIRRQPEQKQGEWAKWPEEAPLLGRDVWFSRESNKPVLILGNHCISWDRNPGFWMYAEVPPPPVPEKSEAELLAAYEISKCISWDLRNGFQPDKAELVQLYVAGYNAGKGAKS
jgi:hypothetical protein